jgi:hypothetical protein
MKNSMKFSFGNSFNLKRNSALDILLGAHQPDQKVLEALSQTDNLSVREAFSTRGVLQNLSGVHLVILGDLLPISDVSEEILHSALDKSGIPVVTQDNFVIDPAEWLGRARLTSAKQVSFLPARQINLVNWSGGVGKTTLAMAVCKRFVRNTGLPAALLELSMGGSALHARISPDLPDSLPLPLIKQSLLLEWGQLIPDGWPNDRCPLERRPARGSKFTGRDPTETHTFCRGLFSRSSPFLGMSKPKPGLINLSLPLLAMMPYYKPDD